MIVKKFVWVAVDTPDWVEEVVSMMVVVCTIVVVVFFVTVAGTTLYNHSLSITCC